HTCYKRLHKTYFDRRGCCHTGCLFLLTKLAKGLCLPHSNRALVFPFAIVIDHGDSFDHCVISIGKGGDCESGEEFVNRIGPLNPPVGDLEKPQDDFGQLIFSKSSYLITIIVSKTLPHPGELEGGIMIKNYLKTAFRN